MEVVVLVIWTNDDALMRQPARVFPKACASMRICLRGHSCWIVGMTQSRLDHFSQNRFAAAMHPLLSLFGVSLLMLSPAFVSAQEPKISQEADRLAKLESGQKAMQIEWRGQLAGLEKKLEMRNKSSEALNAAFFVSGVLCALWAQYTRRSPWVWFFFGGILAPLALLMLLWKNAEDLESGRVRFWANDAEDDAG